MQNSQPVDIFSKYNKYLKWLVFIFALLLYANTINHEWALDDYSVIVNHSHVQNGIDGIDEILTTNYRNGNSGFNDGLYRPLSLVFFAIEKEFFESNTTLAHLINILLYAFGSILLFLSLKDIFKDKVLLIPLGITVLFIAHPLHTEVVANIKSRDELLAFFGFALALYYALRLVESKSIKHITLSLIGFTIALFSKESAVTYGIIIPLLIYLKQGTSFKKHTLHQLALFLPFVVLFMLLRTYIVQGMENPVDPGNFGLLNNPIAAEQSSDLKWGSSFSLQFLFWSKLILPTQLIHDYSFAQIPLVSIVSWESISGIIILAFLLLVSIWGILKQNRWGIIAAIYGLSIVISSQILLPIGIQFAERMLFMTVLPFALFVILGLERLFSKGNQLIVRKQKMLLGTIAIILVLFSLKTIDRNGDWKNNLSLYSADAQKGDKSARINYNYGSELNEMAQVTQNIQQKQQYAKKSIVYLKKAIAIYPDYLDAYNNLGLAYKNQGDYKNAILVFQQGILKDVSYLKNHYNLGTVYYMNKQYREAIISFQTYVNQIPSADAYYLMGQAAGNLNAMKEAIGYLNQAVALYPNHADAHHFLGIANGIVGNAVAATDAFYNAVQLQPRNTAFLMNLAISYRNLGQPDRERATLQQVLAINPNHQQAKAHLNAL